MAQPVTIAAEGGMTYPIALEIHPRGLTVNKVEVNADGQTHDLVQGPFDPSQVPYKYVNTIIGRYSNRVPVPDSGELTISKDDGGEEIVKPQPNERPTVSLHGGPNGIDTLTWNRISLNDAKLFSPAEKRSLAPFSGGESGVRGSIPGSVIFSATTTPETDGYPGTLYTEVLFTLIGPASVDSPPTGEGFQVGQILVVYRSKLDGAKVSPINLTQHWGFNLEGSLKPYPSVRDHYVTVNAPHILEVDQYLLPTGRSIPTAGTPHQHQAKRLGDRFEEVPGGYDHFYLFSKEDYENVTRDQPNVLPYNQLESLDKISALLNREESLHSQVELWSEKTGFKLQFTSNQGGVQLYAAMHQDPTKTKRKKIHGGKENSSDDGYPPEGALFLEFHNPLSTFLHKVHGIDSLITPDDIYHNYVKVNVRFQPLPAPEA